MKILSPELPVQRELVTDRVDLDSSIEQILSGTFKSEPATLDLPKEKLTFAQAEPIWYLMEVERSAIVSILISRIWNQSDFIAERQVFLENSERVIPNETYYLFNKHIHLYFQKYVRENKIDPIVERYGEMIDFFRTNFDSYATAITELQRGAGTAEQVVWGLPRVIATISKDISRVDLPNFSQDDLYNLTKEAYKKIGVLLASMDREVTVGFLDSITLNGGERFSEKKYNRLDYSFFNIAFINKKWTLQVDRKKLSDLHDSYGNKVFEVNPNMINTWCPARYKVEGRKDVISEYFDWVLEVMKKCYFPYI